MNHVKHTAMTFIRKNNLKFHKISLKSLITVAQKNGFIVKSYSECRTIMIAFGIYDEVLNADSVSLVDSKGNVIIFISDSLSEEKQLFTLAHEIGHILLKHCNDTNDKQRQEDEADAFARYLLNKYLPKKSITLMSAIITVIFSALFISVNLFQVHSHRTIPASTENNSTSELEMYYYTPSGKVYHLYKDCSYINNAKDVISVRKEDSHKKRICSRCAGRLINEKQYERNVS